MRINVGLKILSHRLQPGPRVLFLTLLILVSGIALAKEPLDVSKLQGLGNTRHVLLESGIVNRPYHLYVRVPDSFASNPTLRYPTVYLLDGGVSFPLLSAWYHYQRYTDEIPELVLVGIAYGSDSFEEGNYRSTDFTAASKEREFWGGAAKFQQVMDTEIIPLIEQDYPANPKKRILFGQSLGGQFAVFNALTRPDLFYGLIASNPALHRNLDFFMAWRGDGNVPIEATRLFFAQGEFDAEQFRIPAGDWVRHWTRPDSTRPFELEVRYLPGQTHVSAAPDAFRQGILWLLPEGRSTPEGDSP